MEAALIARIGAPRYGLWFADHTAFRHAGGELVISVANRQFQEYLEQTFGPQIRAATAEVCGEDVAVRFSIEPSQFGDEESSAEPEKPTAKVNLFGEETDLPPRPGKKKKDLSPPPAVRGLRTGRRLKHLTEFIVGPCNRVAHASAQATVEDPGQGANPLVLHGPVGTGKTHLLEGVCAGLRKAWPEARPCLVTAEEFTTRFVQATRFGKQNGFRRQFRDCSALLLDDLHFLATKRATQEEFLHTFDSLTADGRQVVVTMDCHPRLAEELMPELVDRLLGGAIWGLLPPDDETRLGILRAKAGVSSPTITDDVLKYLARNLNGNVRELEGAINSVRHFARVTGRPVDQSLVREALGDLLRHTVRTVGVADVDHAICTVLRLSSGVLQSKARSWAVSHPRMLAIYLARKHTAATYGEISRYFGAKTHSTAVAAEKKVREWLTKDVTLPMGERAWRAKDLLERVERELLR